MDSSNIGFIAYAWRVALVFALLFAVVFALRRWGGAGATKSPQGRLRIVESLAVGPQRHLHIVEVAGRRYLVGATPQSITFLTELESGATPAPKGEPPS